MPSICVYAASSRNLPEEFYAAADLIGRRLGADGFDLVFGGANIGLMNSVARGFKSAGAKVISVIPHLFDKSRLTFVDSDEVLLTEDLRHRKRIMESRADAFLVLPGGPGTLDEFFETLTLKQLGLVKKPIVILNQNGHFDGTLLQIKTCVDRGFADPSLLTAFVVVGDADAAVSALGSALGR